MDNEGKDLKDVEGGEAGAPADTALLGVAELQRSSSFVGGIDDTSSLKAHDEQHRSRKFSGANTSAVPNRHEASLYQFSHSCTSMIISKGMIDSQAPFVLAVWDPQISAQRREYLKIIIRAMILTIILTWSCLPMYVALFRPNAFVLLPNTLFFPHCFSPIMQ